jgi:cytochrome c oxidase subunit 4
MSGPAATEAQHVLHEEEHAHPTEGVYIRIAVILAVLTAIEVGLYYTDFGEKLTNSVLLVLAAGKFVLVVGYFMHLKFDSRILRRLFATGFVLAVAVYIAYLMTLGIFV